MIDGETDGGFTLLELLVALSLLALLSLALSSNVTLGTRVWSTVASGTRAIESVSAFDEDLETQLAHIIPRHETIQSKAGLIDFEGRGASIEFLAEYPMGSGQVSRIVYRVNSAGLSEMRAQHELANALDHSQFEPIHGVRNMRFEYYGSKRNNTVASWSNDWEEMPTLPALIRIITTYSDKQRGELVVAPILSADPSCSYDLITRRCQGRAQ